MKPILVAKAVAWGRCQRHAFLAIVDIRILPGRYGVPYTEKINMTRDREIV